MNIFHSLADLTPHLGPTVVTIGNFDGVHRGHQCVIAEVIASARRQAATSLILTFDPHPGRFLRPDLPQPLLTPLPRKLELLAATGVHATLVLPFTSALSRMSARAFAETILANSLHAIEVHEGENFRFGFEAETGVDGLTALGQSLGFHVQVYAPQHLRGTIVSSSRIRQLIAAGDVSTARALLGRPFTVDSTPASGRGYGTRYTVPTINLAPYPELLPAHGVYITCLEIALPSGPQSFQAVTNIGLRPTFEADPANPAATVETYLLDFHPIALTDTTPLRLTFLKRLRSEIKFPTPEALRTQISRDVQQATRFFSLDRAVGSKRPADSLPQPSPAH